MEVGIEKRKGIDSFVKDYSPGKTEEEKELLSEGNHLSELLAAYKEYDKNYRERKGLLEGLDTVLSPSAINSFLYLALDRVREHDYSYTMGRFVSQLIWNAYADGVSEFVLNAGNLPPINDLGIDLVAVKERRLSLTINGPVGDALGLRASNADFTVHGPSAEKCHPGGDSLNCTFSTSDLSTLINFYNHIICSRHNLSFQNRIFFIHKDGSKEEVRR